MPDEKPETRKIYSVSELSREIKTFVESRLPDVWVEGEISKFFTHTQSGHTYVTLKDDKSVIEGAIWKGVRSKLRYTPEIGDQVVVRGKITTFPARSQYQINILEIEPKGLGALSAAFEKLKAKLAKEGLFKQERKRELPYIAWSVGIVTSPTGAVIRDMIRTIKRRFYGIRIVFAPSPVQGDGAAEKIAEAIDDLNRYGKVDVIIAGRGGGSLEDLWAFNEEVLARAIFRSKIPIISAVGHETDFTIADFVADRRASTPTAAAEIISPQRREVEERLQSLYGYLIGEIRGLTQLLAQQVDDLSMSAVREIFQTHSDASTVLSAKIRALAALNPKNRLAYNRERLTTATVSLRRALLRGHDKKRTAFEKGVAHLQANRPDRILERKRAALSKLVVTGDSSMAQLFGRNKNSFQNVAGKLSSISPLAVLERGYSIVTSDDGKKVYREASQLSAGDKVKIRFSKGKVDATIDGDKKARQGRLF